jgi:BON domain-containing protein
MGAASQGARRRRPGEKDHGNPHAAATGWAVVLAGLLCGCAAYEKCGKGCSGDAQINSELEARLDQNGALRPPNQLHVRTLDGAVYLTGQVATDLQRQEAEQIARQTPGVRQVVNNVSLTYYGR